MSGFCEWCHLVPESASCSERIRVCDYSEAWCSHHPCHRGHREPVAPAHLLGTQHALKDVLDAAHQVLMQVLCHALKVPACQNNQPLGGGSPATWRSL